jgi:N-carbamoyl-L-amino-acid hydrolase
MISAASLAARLAGLDGIGVGPGGAVHRLAWTAEDAACAQWFAAQAGEAELRVDRDPVGNLWACPDVPGPWWAVGSHLDSVRGGGLYDGPLGVACGFEIAHGGGLPIAVICFADEEGARFNTPTFGSKALAGRLDLPRVLERRDEHGIGLAEAMRDAGIDPEGLADAPEWLAKLRGFLEIHIDQSTEVAAAGVPAAVVSSLAARLRLEVELRGRADHAGTTPPNERRDALAAAARLILAAEECAARAERSTELRTTTARILVEPNAATTIAAHAKVWVDARCADAGALDAWQAAFEGVAAEVADRSGVEISVVVASRSDGREFSDALRQALRRAAHATVGRAVPEHVCFAGHDAGVVAEHVPAAMILVRNATGVSHSPAEQVELEDAAVAARIAARALSEVGR